MQEVTGWNCLKLLMWPWCPRALSVCTSIHTYIFHVHVISHVLTHTCSYTHPPVPLSLHMHTQYILTLAHILTCLFIECLLTYTLICLYLHPHTCTFTHSMQQVGLLTCCLYSCPHTFVCLLMCLSSSPMHTPSSNHSGVWGACVRDRHSQLGVDLT